MRTASGKESVLSLCCAWSAEKGGIMAFNQALLTTFAAAGHPTACLAEEPSRSEIEHARDRGVVLLSAERTPAGPSMVLDSPTAQELKPAIVIGHDRFTGPSAWVQTRRFHRGAKFVHIVHTAAAELERFRTYPVDATLVAEERELVTRRIAADADVVAAVGPRLWRHTTDLLEEGIRRTRVWQLDPGLGPWHSGARSVPAKQQVLILGRTNDLELKGVDIAARAVASVITGPSPLTLLVRGAPAAECDTLHRKLVALSGLSRERIDVRPFTTDPGELMRDLVRATVCVMPSRVEGFGLVALDAIAAGTPLLVSAKSGVAELLRARLGSLAGQMVVDVTDDLDTDTGLWGNAIARVIGQPLTALRHAADVRQRLVGELTWQNTVAALLHAVDTAQPPPRGFLASPAATGLRD